MRKTYTRYKGCCCYLLCLTSMLAFLLLSFNSSAQDYSYYKTNKVGAFIEQAQNGGITDIALDPPEYISPVTWIRGNVNESKGHYVENWSIPYRTFIDGIPVAAQSTQLVGPFLDGDQDHGGALAWLDIEYDIKHSGKHAIDFLTHYQNFDNDKQDHSAFHSFPPGSDEAAIEQELVEPWNDYFTDEPGFKTDFLVPVPNVPPTIPVPSIPNGENVPNSLQNGATALTPYECFMNHYNELFGTGGAKITAWNAIITDVQINYLGNLVDAQSATGYRIYFRPVADKVIVAWGGHIACTLSWGWEGGTPDGESMAAGGINGSPYHMRLKGISYKNSVGNQDLQLSASAVAAPPALECTAEGSTEDCFNDDGTLTVTFSGGVGTVELYYAHASDLGNRVFVATGLTEVDDSPYPITIPYDDPDVTHPDMKALWNDPTYGNQWYAILIDEAGTETTCPALINLPPPSPLQVDDPGNLTIPICQTQQQVNDAFGLWLGGFQIADPGFPPYTIKVNDVEVANGATELTVDMILSQVSAPLLPECNGASVPVKVEVTDKCLQVSTAEATFTVPPVPDLLFSCPIVPLIEECTPLAVIEQTYNDWVDQVIATAATGACDRAVFVTPERFPGIDMCLGGSFGVTVSAEGYDADGHVCWTDGCDLVFSVPATPPLLFECPIVPLIEECTPLAVIEQKYNDWVDQVIATAATGACDRAVFVTPERFPGIDMCLGGSFGVTVSAEGYDADGHVCWTDGCDLVFSVPATPPLLFRCPVAPVIEECTDLADVEATYNKWRDEVMATAATGACDAKVFVDPFPVIDQCLGGIFIINISAEGYDADGLVCWTDGCSVELIVPPVPRVWAECEAGSAPICSTEDEIDAAFKDWKATFKAGGGCPPLATNEAELDALDWRDFGNAIDGINVPFTFTATDKYECYTASATCEFTVDPCPPKCETAFGYHKTSMCFLENPVNEFSRWGWTTLIKAPVEGTATYLLDLYAGTPVCDPTTQEWANHKVGTVDITYTPGVELVVHYHVFNGYLDEVHINVECPDYPFDWNDGWSVAPGLFTFNGDASFDKATDVTVNFLNRDGSAINGDVWIIAHSVVCTIPIDGWRATEKVVGTVVTHYGIDCGPDQEKSAEIQNPTFEESALKVYPNPFTDKVTFEFVSGRDAYGVLEIFNITGQKVARILDRPVEEGVMNRVEYTPEHKVSGMYIYRLDLDGERQVGRIIYKE